MMQRFMSSNKLMRPFTILDNIYFEESRSFSFKVGNKKEYNLWRKSLKAKLIDLLGCFPAKKCPLKPRIIEEKECKDYIRRKVIFFSRKDAIVSAYLLIPKEAVKESLPAVIALHGHGYGSRDIVGLWENGSERHIPDGYQKHFALEFVKRKSIILAPDILCFGERRETEDIKMGYEENSCRKTAFYAMLLGKTVLGLRVWDVIRCIDYLQTLSMIDKNKIGCMGISGGGMLTLFSSALDERIKAAVVSGCLNTFRESIVKIKHCECNYVPGILKYAEMYDIASLIAPRPLLVESGTKDNIFPISPAKRAYKKVKEVYKFLGVPERLDCDFFEGRHQISGKKAYNWLVKWLRNEKILL